MAEVNLEIVERVAQKIKELPLGDVRALDFTEEDKFPRVDDPDALEYFFVVTMQDYGFWIGDEKGYVEPLYGEVGGKKLKGSDLLWTLSMKIYREKGPKFFNRENLAKLEYYEFIEWLPEKYGFQDLMTRYRMAVDYGNWDACSLGFPPGGIVRLVNGLGGPLTGFLGLTPSVPGYDKDPLLKKNILLAMILANRPEKFLKVEPEEKWSPIVDYHLMRVALRLGLVSLNLIEYDQLKRRVWVDAWMENQVRKVVFDAIRLVIKLSGWSMSKIDFLLWSARKYCPEMTEPDCPKCIFSDVCQKRTELFQPVFRTTNY